MPTEAQVSLTTDNMYCYVGGCDGTWQFLPGATAQYNSYYGPDTPLYCCSNINVPNPFPCGLKGTLIIVNESTNTWTCNDLACIGITTMEKDSNWCYTCKDSMIESGDQWICQDKTCLGTIEYSSINKS